ncbi:MAG: hypothetical protein QF926_01475 [Alphaproteobacteria bacterium]|jgi:hypothetical protein|nr:hypothetical protein [Alphaproteobacteria bacterium]
MKIIMASHLTNAADLSDDWGSPHNNTHAQDQDMPNTPKCDWRQVEAAWLDGTSFHALAKVFPVSRQAIDKRIKREGWSRDDGRWRHLAEQIPTTAALGPVDN